MKKATKQSRRTARRKARQREAWASFVKNVKAEGTEADAYRVDEIKIDDLIARQKHVLMTGYARGWR